MARTKLSTLPRRFREAGNIRMTGPRVVNEGASNRYVVFDFVRSNGTILFSVQAVDCFDGEGNFFEEDI